MRRFVIYLAFLASAIAAGAQDKSPFNIDIRFIPRFEGQLAASSEEGTSVGLGSSSIYTVMNVGIREHLSFKMTNRWLSDDPAGLYGGSFSGKTRNWMDMCNARLSYDHFDFTLGKDKVAVAGIDMDLQGQGRELIHDAFADNILASYLWQDMPYYQWGAKAAFKAGRKNPIRLSLQACTSPYSEVIFKSMTFMYSAQFEGWFGPYHNNWSVSAVERSKGRFDYLVTIGNTLAFGPVTVEASWYNSMGYGVYNILGGNTIRTGVTIAPSKRWDLALRGNGYYSKRVSGTVAGVCGGAAFHFYPLRNSQSIRTYASAGYDSLAGNALASAGVVVDLVAFSLKVHNRNL